MRSHNDRRHPEGDKNRTTRNCTDIVQPESRQPEADSLFDILRKHARTHLYVLPTRWTDHHSRALDARFRKQPAIDRPVPKVKAWLEQSPKAQMLALELDTLLSSGATAARTSQAIGRVISTLFAATSPCPKPGAKLNLYLGGQIFREAVYIPCLWTIRSTDTSAPTPRGRSRQAGTELVPNAPILAYINSSQLAERRGNHSRPSNIARGPVARLQQRRSRLLVPADADQDPYIVAILLTMAQAHFYHEALSRLPSPFQSSSSSGRQSSRISVSPFRDVKVHVITHEGQGDAANFVVYTAIVTTTFLTRFMLPHKGPGSEDSKTGMEISYTRVSIWPMLGLSERLAKALGPEFAGGPMHEDPDHIGFWDPLVESPPLTRKRKRAGNSSSREGRLAGKPFARKRKSGHMASQSIESMQRGRDTAPAVCQTPVFTAVLAEAALVPVPAAIQPGVEPVHPNQPPPNIRQDGPPNSIKQYSSVSITRAVETNSLPMWSLSNLPQALPLPAWKLAQNIATDEVAGSREQRRNCDKAKPGCKLANWTSRPTVS